MKFTDKTIKALRSLGIDADAPGEKGSDFSYKDCTFLWTADPEQDELLQITLPGITAVTDDNRARIEDIANSLNCLMPGVKALTREDTACLCFEFLLDRATELDRVLRQALETMGYCACIFHLMYDKGLTVSEAIKHYRNG